LALVAQALLPVLLRRTIRVAPISPRDINPQNISFCLFALLPALSSRMQWRGICFSCLLRRLCRGRNFKFAPLSSPKLSPHVRSLNPLSEQTNSAMFRAEPVASAVSGVRSNSAPHRRQRMGQTRTPCLSLGEASPTLSLLQSPQSIARFRTFRFAYYCSRSDRVKAICRA
jgi:hypothetical protein